MTEPDISLREALADRYRIGEEIGAGGMATVYVAEDLRHRRRVAIKVLRPELAESLGAERFLKEIETTANLRHPHILPLYDSGQVGGSLFYVMPLVEGESLRERIEREKQLPLEDAFTIAREVAGALGYAHGRGVVHRDIKPENILLEGGHAVVADFGIATALSAAGQARLTQTGLAVGTPLYMSPEQASGSADIDGRSDIYALACVLYEMLTGEPPFTGASAVSITRQHLLTDPAPVSAKRASVPGPVTEAITRALSKTPADRQSSVGEFSKAFETSWPPIAAGAAGAPSRRGPRRSRLGPVGLAGTAVAVVAAGWIALRPGRGEVDLSIERIAVLPMDNQTGDDGQGFFADGMTREVIGVLSDAGVRVLGHRAVAGYRSSTLSSAAIASALDVDAIVTGAVLQVGEVVQVSAELIDPRSGESLWARNFSRPATDVVTLQHDVAREIAEGIHARLTPDQSRLLAGGRPVDPKAYAQYLLGQEQAVLRTPDGYVRSVRYLNRSIELDSTFAPAWAALALTNAYALLYQLAPTDSARAVITRASDRAIALDDRLGDPWYARGVAHLHADWNFAAAEDDFRRGRERSSSTMARGLHGWTLWETGRYAEATGRTLELVDLEPTTAQWRSDLAWSYWSTGDSAAARASLLAAIEADSTFYEAWDLLGMVESDAGNLEASALVHERAIHFAGGDYWVRQFSEAVLYEAMGDLDGVRRVQLELEGDPRFAQRAVIAYLLGDTESTYALLERAVESRDGDVLWVLTSIPYLEPLRGEGRYEELMRRVGLK